jgi:hypothetical protein
MNSRANHRDSHLGSAVQYAVQAFQHLRVLEAWPALHTWGQNLRHHPHIHCVIPAGGLSPDHRRWIHPRYRFLLPRNVLSRVFRGKFVTGLKRSRPQLTLSGALQPSPSGSSLCLLLAYPVPARLGDLPQTAFRWSPACLALSRRLHPPRRHFQSPLGQLPARPGYLSLQGLRARQQETHDDAVLARVLTTIPAARSSPWIRPHSFPRIPRQSTQGQLTTSLSTATAASSAPGPISRGPVHSRSPL